MHSFLAAAVLLSISQAQDNPWQTTLVRAVKNSVADTSKPFVLAVRFKIKDPQKFEAAAAKHVKETRKDKGCQAYELSRTPKGSEFVIYQRWENLAAFDAHLKTAHFKTAMAAFEPLLDGDLDVHISVPVAID